MTADFYRCVVDRCDRDFQTSSAALRNEEDAAAGGVDGQDIQGWGSAGGLGDIEGADEEGQAAGDQGRPLLTQGGAAPVKAGGQLGRSGYHCPDTEYATPPAVPAISTAMAASVLRTPLKAVTRRSEPSGTARNSMKDDTASMSG